MRLLIAVTLMSGSLSASNISFVVMARRVAAHVKALLEPAARHVTAFLAGQDFRGQPLGQDFGGLAHRRTTPAHPPGGDKPLSKGARGRQPEADETLVGTHGRGQGRASDQ
jgi:hypothetical protein